MDEFIKYKLKFGLKDISSTNGHLIKHLAGSHGEHNQKGTKIESQKYRVYNRGNVYMNSILQSSVPSNDFLNLNLIYNVIIKNIKEELYLDQKYNQESNNYANENYKEFNTNTDLLNIDISNNPTIREYAVRLTKINDDVDRFKDNNPFINNKNLEQIIITDLVEKYELIAMNLLDIWIFYYKQELDYNLERLDNFVKFICDINEPTSIHYRITNYLNSIYPNKEKSYFIGNIRNKINPIFNKIRQEYSRIAELTVKYKTLKLFNKRYEFKCQKFGPNKVFIV